MARYSPMSSGENPVSGNNVACINAPNRLSPVAMKWQLIARLADFDCKRFSALWGVSQRHMERISREQFGVPTQEWLDEQRMYLAEQLLGTLPLNEVARRLNYKHLSHFCKRFKTLRGMTPTEFVLQKKR